MKSNKSIFPSDPPVHPHCLDVVLLVRLVVGRADGEGDEGGVAAGGDLQRGGGVGTEPANQALASL